MALAPVTTLHCAVRSLARTPALTIATIVTLALGIGASTALFTVGYGVLLRPLPFRDPGRLVQFSASRQSRGGAPMDFSLPEFSDWEGGTQSFEGLALFGFNQYSLSDDGGAEAVRGAVVSGRFFSVLGVGVAAGRPLMTDDERTGSVVISHRLWTRRFQADPRAIGRSLVLNGEAFSVVGAAEPSFTFPARDVDVWVPAEYAALSAPPQWRMRGFRAFTIIGRLKPGVGLAQARDDVAKVARGLAQSHPRFNQDTAASVASLADRRTARIRPALLVLLGAVGLVLLVACANVASLALARTAERAREIATRTALGATRAHLALQFLSESALLAVAGAAAGLLVAAAAIAVLQQVGPADLPRLEAIRIDGAALAFCGTLSACSVFLFGTLPALHLAGRAPAHALRDGRGASSRGGRRVHAWLVVGEVALSVVLVVGAALLARSLGAMLREDLGVANRGALTLKINLSSPAFADPARQAAFLDRLIPAIAEVPAVESVGVTSHLPPDVSQMRTTVSATNEVTGRQDEYGVEIVAANDGLFRTLGVPLVAGRLPSAGDTNEAPRVVVLSVGAAQRLFKDGDAVGKTVAIGPRDPSGGRRDPLVVGIVGDVRYSGFDAAPDGAIYMPYAQRPFRVMYVVVRATGQSAGIVGDIRRRVAGLDPSLAVSDVRSVDSVVSDAVAQPRFRSLLMALLAGLAVLLAGSGIYGVLAHAVGQRTPEIGLRMALGADRSSVRRMVVGEALVLCACGIGLGLAGAVVLARAMGTFLYGVGRADPLSFIAGPVFLLAVTLAATYMPARWATRVDPLVALRDS